MKSSLILNFQHDAPSLTTEFVAFEDLLSNLWSMFFKGLGDSENDADLDWETFDSFITFDKYREVLVRFGQEFQSLIHGSSISPILK
jgi:hypothetical protein